MVWKIFFKTRSATEHGTLYQLKNLIKRCNVRMKPKSNFDACDNFLKTVITGYILALAMSLLGMETVDDTVHVVISVGSNFVVCFNFA